MTVQEKIKEINLQNALRITNDWLSAVQSEELKYKEPCFKCGEMEAIKKALEKQIPKKPQKMTSTILIGAGWKYKCPNCELGIGENEHDLDLAFTQNESYCPSCGQKLDWKEGGTSEF